MRIDRIDGDDEYVDRSEAARDLAHARRQWRAQIHDDGPHLSGWKLLLWCGLSAGSLIALYRWVML